MRRSNSVAARAADEADRGHDPIGIVIADGGTRERAPRFSAFVWGPVPDNDADEAPAPLAVADGRAHPTAAALVLA